MDKWRSLLSQINFTGAEYPTFTDTEIEEFEQKTGIILPQDCKDYCKVFGNGMFSELYDINCLNAKMAEECKDDLLISWNMERDSLTKLINRFGISKEEEEELTQVNQIIELITRSFVFASKEEQFFLWDLDSYNNLNRSYKIWTVELELPYFYCIGSDFFEFARDFCLGLNRHKYDYMHTSMRPEIYEDLVGFERFPKEYGYD
ncbi:hypothetical protein Pse7367_1786 [Thalassoporum mexicanum PCC 7367]|nr:hypothetical protein Pse7367_1786 [Pseudanabaena sp. PCC 7367]